MIPGRPKLATIVSLAYTLIIVYASLQPFEGWRAPAEDVFRFLTAPWPRYVTAGDLTLNVIAYLPYGAMLFAMLRPPMSAAPAFAGTLLTAGVLSLALESAQMFLPARIASNIDVLTNTSGAAIGAVLAWVLALPNNPLAVVRRDAIREGTLGDCGLFVVVLWVLIQFHQAPLALGTGDLRDMLHIAPLFAHTPTSYLLVETGIVSLITMGIGLVVSLLLRPRRSPWPAIAITLFLALAAKSIAAVTLAQSASWLHWLTPGVAAGIGIGVLLLAGLLRMPHAGRTVIALASIIAVVFIVNAAPENPYQLVPAFMLRPQPAHLVNLSHILRALSQAWPMMAVLLLLFLWRDARLAKSRQSTSVLAGPR